MCSEILRIYDIPTTIEYPHVKERNETYRHIWMRKSLFHVTYFTSNVCMYVCMWYVYIPDFRYSSIRRAYGLDRVTNLAIQETQVQLLGVRKQLENYIPGKIEDEIYSERAREREREE